jgi:hypothetical protein
MNLVHSVGMTDALTVTERFPLIDVLHEQVLREAELDPEIRTWARRGYLPVIPGQRT